MGFVATISISKKMCELFSMHENAEFSLLGSNTFLHFQFYSSEISLSATFFLFMLNKPPDDAN